MSSEKQGNLSIIQLEKLRYLSKGSAIFPALAVIFIYFFVLPSFLHKIYALLPYDNMTLMFVVVTNLVIAICGITVNLFFYILYTKKIPYFEQYRISQTPWPWESDPKYYKTRFYPTLINVLFNHFILLPATNYFGVAVLNAKMSFKLEDLPSGLNMFCTIIFIMIIEDFSFYWIHRLFHTPWMYKKFHKKHHEYKITIGLASSYAHPVEFLLGNVFPAFLGGMILGQRCHLFTLLMWVAIKNYGAVSAHSGYDFPWSPISMIPFSSGAIYHDFHHSHNVGNFGSLLAIWDDLCGTNKPYLGHLAKKYKSN